MAFKPGVAALVTSITNNRCLVTIFEIDEIIPLVRVSCYFFSSNLSMVDFSFVSAQLSIYTHLFVLHD